MIDPRGPRFGAFLTSAVLAVALLVPASAAVWLLLAQAVVFALGTQCRSPYQALYTRFVKPRLAPPQHLEDDAPPRFAQAVGLAFVTAAVLSLLAGGTLTAQVFTGFALVAALLNAVVGLCLGCEVYLFLKRYTKGATA